MLHSIELPSRIIIGSNALRSLRELVEAFGARGAAAVVITGPNVWRKYGERLRSVLEDVVELEALEAREPSVDYAERLSSEAAERSPRLVIGFGGGKSVDLAKYVAHKLGVPLISVPTSPSHDGIASPFASLRGLNKPFSVRSATPAAIVADIDIIASAPLRLIRAGAGDLVAKLTAIRDWRLAHRLKGEYYGEYAAKLALLSAKHVMEYAAEIGRGSKEAVRVLVEGLVSSGVAMCIAGSTRPASGSEHLFSHALDLLAPGRALHGEQVALGTIMMMYLHGGDWRQVRKTLMKLGLPVRARDLGIDDETVIKALTMAHKLRPERYTILGETGLTWEAAERLARVTGVID
ncbi:glycerol-1-phosphate dehydrogenase [Pyrodictium occultum]|uniref:Glycerol-1-phosphate dehydrogenase [NAD(P)+] n=1 Tax=Pyrodictium occultum TaxID=2309 RepID=A0A0V8RUA9_PYROC|nr:NAD(P)-dependent glycerol-1-phosphate dehydrogenase [Pyrodictium occultum]KSW11655.1 glycerol-1-phosphate dehydrogenase [Pyrodictium occultum]